MNDGELVYVPAEIEDADWWIATKDVATATTKVADATTPVARSRVDLVIEAWLEHIEPHAAEHWRLHGHVRIP